VISEFSLDPRAVRLVATLSLDALQGGVLRRADGAFSLANAQPDPERPGFICPWLVAAEARVFVGVDADMKPQPARILEGRKVVERPLDSAERASLCAALVRQNWSRAGVAVSVHRPPLGYDFNDLDRRAQP
jgi:hypothetical protein